MFDASQQTKYQLVSTAYWQGDSGLQIHDVVVRMRSIHRRLTCLPDYAEAGSLIVFVVAEMKVESISH